MSDDRNENRILNNVPLKIDKYHERKLKEYSEKLKFPISRLILMAIHNELQKEKPFDLDVTLPDSDGIPDITYAQESGRILDFLNKAPSGLELELMVLLRHSMGIPDKNLFLLGFKACLNNNLIEAVKPIKRFSPFSGVHYSYRITGGIETEETKAYKNYLKLKNKFEKIGKA